MFRLTERRAASGNYQFMPSLHETLEAAQQKAQGLSGDFLIEDSCGNIFAYRIA
jgi:hypothetical protein